MWPHTHIKLVSTRHQAIPVSCVRAFNSVQPCHSCAMAAMSKQAGTTGWPTLILVLSAVLRAGAWKLPGAGRTCESRCVCRGQQGIPSASSSGVKGAAGIGFACAAAAERASISRASPASGTHSASCLLKGSPIRQHKEGNSRHSQQTKWHPSVPGSHRTPPEMVGALKKRAVGASPLMAARTFAMTMPTCIATIPVKAGLTIAVAGYL